jgi:hypothetical protein
MIRFKNASSLDYIKDKTIIDDAVYRNVCLRTYMSKKEYCKNNKLVKYTIAKYEREVPDQYEYFRKTLVTMCNKIYKPEILEQKVENVQQ